MTQGVLIIQQYLDEKNNLIHPEGLFGFDAGSIVFDIELSRIKTHIFFRFKSAISSSKLFITLNLNCYYYPLHGKLRIGNVMRFKVQFELLFNIKKQTSRREYI